MKSALLAVPLLAAGALTVGCIASASASTAVSAVSSSATGSGAAASGTRACTTADLAVSLGGGTGAGMDQDHTGLQLRNTGSSACTLYGYPGVSWVAGPDVHQVGAAAVWGEDGIAPAEKAVTLAPGALASAPFDIVDAAAFTPSQCKAVPVRGLRVYPPGEKVALFLSLPTSAGQYGECSNPEDAELSIGYLQAGAQPA